MAYFVTSPPYFRSKSELLNFRLRFIADVELDKKRTSKLTLAVRAAKKRSHENISKIPFSGCDKVRGYKCPTAAPPVLGAVSRVSIGTRRGQKCVNASWLPPDNQIPEADIFYYLVWGNVKNSNRAGNLKLYNTENALWVNNVRLFSYDV